MFSYKKNKKRQDGRCPLYVRIAVSGRNTEVFLKYHLLEGEWNIVMQRAAKGAIEAEIINALITDVASKINREAADLRIAGKIFTARIIKERLTGHKNGMSLMDLLIKHNNDMAERVSIDYSSSTHKKYELTQKKVKQFITKKFGVGDIELAELNVIFIEGFESFLKVNQKLSHNTAMKHIKNLKKVAGLGVRMDLLDKNPFESFKCSVREVNRLCLNQQDIDLLIQKKTLNDRLNAVKDIFLFSCYTGLSYVDVVLLSQNHIHGNCTGEKMIIINRAKTKVESRIPVLPYAEVLIEKYSKFSESSVNNRLFPVKSNQKINEYLKEIANLCGITKILTFHLARHTFATTIALKNGVSMEVVKAILGHKNICTTQIYAKMVDLRLTAEMKALSQILESKNSIL